MSVLSFSDRRFGEKALLLDGKRFVGCTLVRCRLTYRGGTLPVFKDSHLGDCNFITKDAAANTLAFLGVLYRNGEGGLIDSLIAQLRGEVSPVSLPSLAPAAAR